MNDVVREISNRNRLLLKKLNFCKMTFDIFKNEAGFIKDPLHRTESLIWSYHKLQAFYFYSNYKLKIYGSVRKISHKTSLLVELLKF